jgi:hypothetical protein
MKLTAKILLIVASLALASAANAGQRYGHYRGGHHGHHGNGGEIAGALIVGGLIGHVLTQRRYAEPRPVYRTVYVESTSQPIRSYSQPIRSYRRESDGSCYLINYRDNGDQVATVVPRMNCE